MNGRLDMKKKRNIFLLLCSVLIMLIGCSKKNNDDNPNDFLMQYINDYKLKQENVDGTFEISVIIPDFEEIMRNLAIDKLQGEISIESINNLVNEYPDCKKEYVVIVSDISDKEEIEAILNKKIAEELIKSAIINNEYKEEWSIEE